MPAIQIENGSYVFQKCVNCMWCEDMDEGGYCEWLADRSERGMERFPFTEGCGSFGVAGVLLAIWCEDGPFWPEDPGFEEALKDHEPEIFR